MLKGEEFTLHDNLALSALFALTFRLGFLLDSQSCQLSSLGVSVYGHHAVLGNLEEQ